MKSYDSYTHPCYGKDCMECETCIFDRPLEEAPKEHKTLRADETCNYCGYLIKQYGDRGGEKRFNACCSKERIEGSRYSRPRTIDFNLTDLMDIEKPEWCPKLKENVKPSGETPLAVSLTYTEKRDRLKALPPHLDWSQIEVGKKYVIPSILGRRRKILQSKYKTEFTLVCNEVKEDGTLSSDIINIFKTDIDTNFIVEYKNF